MSTTNDGGPAFPFDPEASGVSCRGMSLRDYFAADAMKGLLSHRGIITSGQALEVRITAEDAYQVADAMLAARDPLKTQLRESVLVEALKKIISMNRQQALDQYGDAEKAEAWGCVVTARAALAAAGGVA